MGLADNVDVTGSIRAIERLKAGLIMSLANLYDGMALSGSSSVPQSETLAELVADVYLLGNRLGISHTALDNAIRQQLKLKLLRDGGPLHEDYAALLRHIGKGLQEE